MCPTAGAFSYAGRTSEHFRTRLSATCATVRWVSCISSIICCRNLRPWKTLPLLIRRTPKEEALAKAKVALDVLGLSERLTHLPSQLSGGERQRTAIARAMVADPACILADEPTGNLDRDTALEVFDCLVKTAKAKGTAVVIVTHDLQIASRCDRVLRLAAGVIEEVSGV